MRILKSRWFDKFAQRERISDQTLCNTVALIVTGAINADYGGGLIKQRIARAGQGKSGGYRAIIVFRAGRRLVFVWGFAKSDQANLDSTELREFKEVAKTFLAYSESEIEKLIAKGLYSEVRCHEQN
ncbi:MAG: type II toxin-antitoxin system RelE/ParE family toxin [Acidobacteria bacterium]|nr:type II toxin-antitoxin system RelE/ParE family toxin [Acidobacteriota bacterium]